MGFQPVNIASLVSKLIWNITGIQTPGRLSLVPRARRVKEAVYFEVDFQLSQYNVIFDNLF